MRTRTLRLEPVVFHTCNSLVMIVLAVITLYPFLNTLAISLNAGNDTIRGGIYYGPACGPIRTTKPYSREDRSFTPSGYRWQGRF